MLFNREENTEEFDDEGICPICGQKLKKYNEEYEAWGRTGTVEIWQCPRCG